MAVEFHSAADEELNAAATFYEQRREGLGQELADEVQSTCDLLAEYPTIGRKIDQIHRAIPLRRFPFSLFYRVQGSLIHIIAVAHDRKRPGYWRSRR
jgi:toxin ParE1/3/4